jgi:hypothetical protein
MEKETRHARQRIWSPGITYFPSMEAHLYEVSAPTLWLTTPLTYGLRRKDAPRWYMTEMD